MRRVGLLCIRVRKVKFDLLEGGGLTKKEFFGSQDSILTNIRGTQYLLENHVGVVALQPDLQRISIHSANEFLHHSFTIELLSLLALIKGSWLLF